MSNEATAAPSTGDNQEQIDYWNGEAGQRWARQDELMARLLQPVAEKLLEHGDIAGCSSALDVGCGGGSQSMLLAQRLGADARVLGVDISAPLLEVARARAAGGPPGIAPLSFLQADASAHAFEPGSFDLLFSRFGVMFFADPGAAFANLRSALSKNARLLFCCWQSPKQNPWISLPLKVALEHVPPPPPPEPNAPGPFAFADPARLESILAGAGFSNISIAPTEVQMRWSAAGDDEAARYESTVRDLLQIGPASALLADQGDAVRQRVYEGVSEALKPWFDGTALSLPGATWFVTANA